MRVNSYKAKRGSGVVTVSAHSKTNGKFRNIKSSCINRVSEGSNGEMLITIRGVEYPYPALPKSSVSSLVGAPSAGRFYNKNIRGNYF